MKSNVEVFTELGHRLLRGVPEDIMHQAYVENGWFQPCDIDRAVLAICETMLPEEALRGWLSGYTIEPRGERVLIVMAGNIPLVGFFDLLCVLMAGDVALVKLSHKDRILMGWVIALLREIEPSIPIYIYEDGEPFDRLIATGGDSAVRHFRELYPNIPTLTRGSRHSIAILDGTEGEGELEALSQDIYSYSGLGCRNVSMIFVPKGYDMARLPKVSLDSLNPKYINNYLQNRALSALSGDLFIDSGVSLFSRQASFPLNISTIAIVEYSSLRELLYWIESNDESLQCIVSGGGVVAHPRRVDFGRAQYPNLGDYADGVDTMLFLGAEVIA